MTKARITRHVLIHALMPWRPPNPSQNTWWPRVLRNLAMSTPALRVCGVPRPQGLCAARVTGTSRTQVPLFVARPGRSARSGSLRSEKPAGHASCHIMSRWVAVVQVCRGNPAEPRLAPAQTRRDDTSKRMRSSLHLYIPIQNSMQSER